MSRVENQRRLFLELIEELRPVWRRDPAQPQRLTDWLSRHRAGSRDRRLYRELAYTTWRILPWIEDASPETLVQQVASRAVRSKATADFIDTFGSPTVSSQHAPESLLPDWLADQCPAAINPEQRDALLSRAPLWVRLQTDQPELVHAEWAHLGLTAVASEHIPDAWQLPTDARITDTDAFRNGQFEIQDVGSQALLHTLPQPLQGHWLDACAGAGGKTLQLARLLAPNGGQVTAHDVRPSALRELRARQKRARITNVFTGSPPTAKYDGVLVDAPCTGSGTWRRAPHLKWTTRTTEIHRSQERQIRLLSEYSDLVQSGGLLVYATCSLCRDENEAVVEAFAPLKPHFQPVALSLPGDSTAPPSNHNSILPADLDSDAYFVAAWQRS